MKIAIMQPTFNPWIGYFDLIDYVDKFIILDTVQLTKRSWQTRNKFKVNNKEKFFSIPIQKTKVRNELLIKDAEISYEQYNFKDKLYTLIQQNYKKTNFYNEVNNFTKELIFFDTTELSLYNINMITKISQNIGINTEIISLSQTNFLQKSSKGRLMLDICQYFNARDYISPIGSYDYLLDYEKAFLSNNINIEFQKYKHPKYIQQGDFFISHLGIIDLIYNTGLKKSLEILQSGRHYENR